MATLFPGVDMCPNPSMCQGCWLTVQMHILGYYGTALDTLDTGVAVFHAALAHDHNPENPDSAKGHRNDADALVSCTRAKLDNEGIGCIAREFQVLRPIIAQVSDICLKARRVFDALNICYLDGDAGASKAAEAIREAASRAEDLRKEIRKTRDGISDAIEEVHHHAESLGARLHSQTEGCRATLATQMA